MPIKSIPLVLPLEVQKLSALLTSGVSYVHAARGPLCESRAAAFWLLHDEL